jgi:hypothetical protein
MKAFNLPSDTGYLGEPKNVKLNKYMIIDGYAHEIHTTVVYKFRVGDAEDPDMYAAQPLYDWRESEMGQWVMERAVETPEWHRQLSPFDYGYQYAVVAKLKGADYTFWTLKWGNQNNT